MRDSSGQVKASSDKAVLTSLSPEALQSQQKVCGLLLAVTISLCLLGYEATLALGMFSSHCSHCR